MIESFNNTWQALRLKDISEMNPMFSCSDEKMVSFVPMEDLRYDSIGDKTIDQEEGRKKYTFFKEDDLLIAKVTPCFENGNISLAKNLKGGIGFGSSEIFVLRFNKQANKRFMFYYCQNKDFKDSAQATMQGVGGLKRIQPLFFRTKAIHLPSLSEQQAIANYLDEKCSKIDASIAALSEMKEKYLSLKKSLINETVCRGLNKNVPLKSSGIDWIGDIPEHWEVKRFKAFAYTQKGKSADYYDDPAEGLDVVLSLNYLRNDSIDFVDYADASDKSQYCDVDDILIIWDGAGVGEILKSKVGVLSSTLAKLIVNERIVSKGYFWYYRNAIDYVLKKNPTGMGIPHLNPLVLNNMKFPIPPLEEQFSIATYLDTQCSKIDAIVENIDSQIKAYTKLKKSLISEVVTGKKRVI